MTSIRASVLFGAVWFVITLCTALAVVDAENYERSLERVVSQQHLQSVAVADRKQTQQLPGRGGTNDAAPAVATNDSISKKQARKHAQKNDDNNSNFDERAAGRARRKKQATASPRNAGPMTEETVGTYLIAELEQFWFFDEPELTDNVEFNDGIILTLTNVSQDWLNDVGTTLDSGVDMIRIPSGVNITGAEIDFNGGEPEVIPREDSPTRQPSPPPTAAVDDDIVPTIMPTTSLPTVSSIPTNFLSTSSQPSSTSRPSSSTLPTTSLLPGTPTLSPSSSTLPTTSLLPGTPTLSPISATRKLVKIEDNRQLQSGVKTILAVRVVASDSAYGFTEVELSNKVFGTDGDSFNLKSQFAQCSYNQLIFEPSPNQPLTNSPNDQTTNIVNGVMSVEIDLEVSLKGWNGEMENAVTEKINQVFGVQSPDELADHIMYCLPDHGTWIPAKAYINHWRSVYNNEYCNYPSVQMHEIGHNLKYAHSNQGGITYADETGVMGYNDEADDGPALCFNSVKSWQSGWYTAKSFTVKLGESYDGDLYGVADFGNSAAKYVLIKIDGQGSDDFYITFNRKDGINSGTVEAANKVTVTKSTLEGDFRNSESSLVATLDSGNQYVAKASSANVIVKVSNIGASSARVVITSLIVKEPECDCSCGAVKSSKATKSSKTTKASKTKTGKILSGNVQSPNGVLSSSKNINSKTRKSGKRELRACKCDCAYEPSDDSGPQVPRPTPHTTSPPPSGPPNSSNQCNKKACCRVKRSGIDSARPFGTAIAECLAGLPNPTANDYCDCVGCDIGMSCRRTGDAMTMRDELHGSVLPLEREKQVNAGNERLPSFHQEANNEKSTLLPAEQEHLRYSLTGSPKSKGSKRNKDSKSYKSKKYSPATSPVRRPNTQPTRTSPPIFDDGMVSSSPTGAQSACTNSGRKQCKRAICKKLPELSPASPIGQCVGNKPNQNRARAFCSCLNCNANAVDC